MVKIPIGITEPPLRDTINVYHFIVSKRNIADSATTYAFQRESKKAYKWITREASLNGIQLHFKETWVNNENPARKNTFVYKLPSRNLRILAIKPRFKMITQKRTRYQKQVTEKVSWRKKMYETMVKQVDDTTIAWMLRRASLNEYGPDNQLIMIHVFKARRSWVNGFYMSGEAFIGVNRSKTIAHESLHHLGAADLYLHKFWFGRRRRIVRKEMRQEIMNNALQKNHDCNNYIVSTYSAYLMGWRKDMEPEFKPLLKENLMARMVFLICMML